MNLIGYTDLTSRLPTTASQLYAQNLVLLKDMGGAENYNVDMEDEVVRGALITRRPGDLAAKTRSPAGARNQASAQARAKARCGRNPGKRRGARKVRTLVGHFWTGLGGSMVVSAHERR